MHHPQDHIATDLECHADRLHQDALLQVIFEADACALSLKHSEEQAQCLAVVTKEAAVAAAAACVVRHENGAATR